MGRYMEPKLKEVLEAGFQGRRPQHHYHSTTTNDLIVSNRSAIKGEYGGNTEKSVYLNNHEGEQVEWSVSGANPGILQDLDVKLVDSDIAKVLNAFINAQDDEREPHDPNRSGERGQHHEEVNSTTEEYDDEEEIELEFERAIKKLDTHTMHCPKCNTQVTKVILRRKRRAAPKQNKPLNLLGCLRCLSVFIPNGNFFNMFGIFGTESSKKPQATPLDESISPGDENTFPSSIPNLHKNVVIQEKAGGCLGLFRTFGNKNDNESIENPLQTSTIDVMHAPSDFSCANGEQGQGKHSKQRDEADENTLGDKLPGDHVTIDIQNDLGENTLGDKLLTESAREFIDEMQNGPAKRLEGDYRNRDEGAMNSQQTGLRAEPIGPSNDQHSKLIEIVKSIVYGGLMESITSLCIVASAAGSDATTLNIIALGLASLIGGFFFIGLNLWDLKDDRYQRANKYQELLGRRENFPLHATLAILSFFVFGLIPPVTYGFSFRTSDDRYFKILAVAATSLLCVILLAIGKAYVEKAPKFYMYIKTIMYYVSIGFIVSGVSFAAGNLINKFIEEHGLLNTSSPASLSLADMSPILASY